MILPSYSLINITNRIYIDIKIIRLYPIPHAFALLLASTHLILDSLGSTLLLLVLDCSFAIQVKSLECYYVITSTQIQFYSLDLFLFLL